MKAPKARLRRIAAIACGLLHATAASADDGLAVAVLTPPVPAIVDGARTLRYEMLLRNTANEPVSLQTVEVRDAATDTLIAALVGTALAAATARQASGWAGDTPLTLEPGANAYVYLDVDATSARRLAHRVSYLRGGRTETADVAPARVDERRAIHLGPPLAGGTYAAVYDPSMAGGHRRYFYENGGVQRVPGWFAIDWFPIDGGPGVGSSVIAVADASVAVAVDENKGPEGVHVVLDLGGVRFAHYEHLLPGLMVREGQRVRRGAQLGRLGATGQVTGPHLHFHLSDGLTSTGWEGRPYLLDNATVVGGYASIEAAVEGDAWTRRDRRQLSGLPAPNAVVEFTPAHYDTAEVH